MSQPKWKRLWSTDYSQVFTDTTGVYPPELEISQEISDEDPPKFVVYRFPLETFKLVRDEEGDLYLVPEKYDETWPHAISRYVPWFSKDLKAIARSSDMSDEEMLEGLTSKDPNKLAGVYEAIGGHWGFDNFDSEPQTLTEKQLNKRWR